MAQGPLFQELNRLISGAGIEIRTENFRLPPESAGGLCRIEGRYLVLLHSGASRAERAEALLEVLEHLGLERLGVHREDISAELLARLTRRGHMPRHHAEDTTISKPAPTSPHKHLRLVPSPPLLAKLTTLGVGGAPDDFIAATTEDQVLEVTRSVQRTGDELFPLGGGSNLVVADSGINGTVLKMDLKGIFIEQEGEEVLVRAAAGESWHDFAQQMSAEGYSGIECLGGIPGSVGATPIQNVGAYGQEVSQTIEGVRVLDRASLQFRDLEHSDCKFTYRGSIFKNADSGRYIVVSVTYRLKRGGEPSLHYGELLRHFGARKNKPSLLEVFNSVVELRRGKSMVHDPKDENGRSCGSFFLNVQLPQAQVDAIALQVGESPPSFSGEGGLIKLPSAWLIERAGLHRGFRLGRAGLSSKHTLAIVAHDGATSADVLRVARHVRDRVRSTFGVELTPEPNFWGFHRLDGGLPVD